jgi:hypothetical protein
MEYKINTLAILNNRKRFAKEMWSKGRTLFMNLTVPSSLCIILPTNIVASTRWFRDKDMLATPNKSLRLLLLYLFTTTK